MELTQAKPTPRERLLAGLAESISEKGLQHTQIGDIVKRARASRRTFYECFPDKESCFIELIRAASQTLVAEIEAAVDPAAPWETQVDQAIDAYLGALAGNPALTATVSRELPTLGARGAALQQEGVDRFARLIVTLASRPEMREAGIEPVDLDTAVMLTGGISELVARADPHDEDLSKVAETAKPVIKAVLAPGGDG